MGSQTCQKIRPSIPQPHRTTRAYGRQIARRTLNVAEGRFPAEMCPFKVLARVYADSAYSEADPPGGLVRSLPRDFGVDSR